MKLTVAGRLPARRDRAWRALVDWERQSEWMLDAASVRVLGDRREGVGTRFAVRTKLFGVPLFTEVLEVATWDPPAGLVVAHSGVLRGFGRWRLRADGPGVTVFEWEEDVRLAIPVLGELAAWIYRPVMRRLMRRAISNLAAYLAATRSASRRRPQGRAGAPTRGRTDASARRRSSRGG